MQVFSGDARVPNSRVIVATMLDLQNLSTLPNLPLLLKSEMVAIALARTKSTPALQANLHTLQPSLCRVNDKWRLFPRFILQGVTTLWS